MRLSGLQTDVLVLYRALLKSAVAKIIQKGTDKTVKATKSELYQFGMYTTDILYDLCILILYVSFIKTTQCARNSVRKRCPSQRTTSEQ